MAINTVWHKSFVQGFNSCSWFAEISLSRKKKEHYRQFNDELQGRMRGAWVASFLYFVFDGVSRFRQQGSCWYWTPSFRRVSNCISFISIARNVVTCEHMIKRNVVLHRFFCVKLLWVLFLRHPIDERSDGFRLSFFKHSNRCNYLNHWKLNRVHFVWATITDAHART